MPPKARGRGRLIRRRTSRFPHIAYFHDGKEVRESSREAVLQAEAKKKMRLTDEESRKVAEKFLEKRLREIANDRDGLKPFVGPQQDRLKVKDLLDNLQTDFKLRGLRSLRQTLSHVRIIRAALGHIKATKLGTATVSRYIAEQLADGVKPATVNRRTTLLRQAFRLALRRHEISAMPEIPKLRENNVRQGFR